MFTLLQKKITLPYNQFKEDYGPTAYKHNNLSPNSRHTTLKHSALTCFIHESRTELQSRQVEGLFQFIPKREGHVTPT